MKNILYFAIPIIIILISMNFWGCDSAEEFAEEQINKVDTTIVITDTIKSHRDTSFVPVKYQMEIQLGSFATRKYAEAFSAKADEILNRKTEISFDDNIYRVTAGRFTIPDRANAYLEYVKEKGFSDAFVRKIKVINEE
jgi:hypothetical protein